jgi:hypothetical protein
MRPEDRLQSRCRMFLDACLPPPCWWSSVGHERKQTPIQGMMQKARGVKRGLPDVMVWAPGYFLGVELKAGKNTTSDAQDGFAEAMARLGHGYVVVRSVEALAEALERHGIPLNGAWRQAAQIHDATLAAAVPVVKRTGKTSGKVSRRPTLAQVARGNAASLFGVKR